MATFLSIVAGVWSFLKAVPTAVYTHGGAFLFGLMFRWIIAVALALALVGGAAAAEPCKCGPNCAAGGGCAPCLCAAIWRPDSEGSADLGLWSGKEFVGRYFTAARQYRPWTGKDYGAAAAVPKPLPVAPQRGPEPIAAPPQPARRFNFVAAPFGGGCAGGSCRR